MQPDGRVILQHSMASLSLKSGALTGLRAPAASCVCFSAKPEPICSFNPHSLAPNAAIRLSRRCRPMPASSSMTARAVANGSSPSRAIAACSALTAQCRVRRYRATCVAACQRFIKCREALKARTTIRWNIKRVDHARQGREASPVRRFIVARGVGPRRSGSSQQVVTLTHLSMFPVGSAS